MTMYRVGPAGIPASLKTNMDAVLNKKFGTSTTYAPATWPDNVNLLGPLPEKTASGAVASITDGADAVPIKSWEVEIAPTLDGVSSISETHTGRNIADVSTATKASEQRCTYVFENGGLTITATGTYARVGFAIPCVKGATYTLSYKGSSDAQYKRVLLFPNELWVSASYSQTLTETETAYNTTFIAQSDHIYIGFYLTTTGSTGTETIKDIQIECGFTVHDYEPYQTPTVYTASLGRTIYGGSVDVVAGTGSTKVHKQTYTGDNVGTVSITYGQAAEGYTHLYFNIADIPLAYNPSSDNVISNITLPWNNNASAAGIPAVGECWRLINGESPQKPIIYMYIHQTWANVSAFKTWLNANPITVVYEVEDETDFTFTPITPTPETPLGASNFWADEGDSDVTYRADINMLIASLSGNRGLMMTRPQLEEITEENKEESPEVTEK